MEYENFIRDRSSFWRKTKQIEFSRKNNGIEKVQEYLTKKFDELTTRNSMTLRIFGLIEKTSDFNSLKLTQDGSDFIEGGPDVKFAIINKNLLNFSLDDGDINPRLRIDVRPFQILLTLLKDLNTISFTEYKFFVCWIQDESEIERVVKLIQRYRGSEDKSDEVKAFEGRVQSLNIADFDDHVSRLFHTFTVSNLLNVFDFDNEVYLSALEYNELSDFNSSVIQPIEIKLKIGENSIHEAEGGKVSGGKKKIDYVKRQENMMAAGHIGEFIVKEFEKENLTKIGRRDLADKVRVVSEYDDTLGYDVLSFDGGGNEKHIEVKAVQNLSGNSFAFFITENEKRAHELSDSHLIYIVFDYKESNPRIFKMPKGFLQNSEGVQITPTSYQVKVYVDKKDEGAR